MVGGGEDEDGDALSSTLLLPAGDAAQWTKGCEMGSARCDAGGAVFAAADAGAHCTLVAGGVDSECGELDTCELYDAVADRWSLLQARLPQAMRCRAAPIADGSAVLAVQWEDSRNMRSALIDVRSSSPSWQPMASAADANIYHTVTAVGEHSVVMLGGLDVDMTRTDTAQLFDVRADCWSERAEWRLPVPSRWHCAALIDERSLAPIAF